MPSGDRKLFLGVFLREADLLAATKATRSSGYSIHDAFTPYAVHGLDEAMGWRPSRLPRVCFAFALAGLALAAGAQFWISAIDWPLNVGGKPFNSLPAFLPAMFELMVFAGGVGTFLVLLLRSRLYPGKRPWLPHSRATDDRFVLAVEAEDASFDAQALARSWERFRLAESFSVLEGER